MVSDMVVISLMRRRVRGPGWFVQESELNTVNVSSVLAMMAVLSFLESKRVRCL